MKRRKRKKRRRRWTTDDGCQKCKRGEQLLVAKKRQERKTRRQIRLRAMPVARVRLDSKFGHNLKMAKLAEGRANELFSERNFSASHSSRAASATRVVHFASSRNKQFMRSLGCSLWLLASCLLAASESGGSLPHLQQQQHIAEAARKISARQTAADDDSTSFITEELSWPRRAETSAARLQLHHDDDDDKQDEQSVFVPPGPINEHQRRRTRATAANETTTTLQDQDQRATDPPLAELDNLPAGSRLVIARESQQIELACDAREFAPLGELATSRNEREFIISGPNKTLRRLEPMDRHKDVKQQSRLGLIQTNNVNDDLDADQLTDRLVSLVFWYKDDDPAPIYTLDARPGAPKLTGGGGGSLLGSFMVGAGNEQRLVSLNKQLLGAAKHYERNRTDHDGTTTTYDWRSRIIADEWPVIKLQLNGVRGSHSGDYKCRVDFRRARTIRRVIRLFVEVPLQSLSLRLSDKDNQITGDINLVQTNRSDEIRESGARDQNRTETVRLNQEQRAEFVCRTNEGKLSEGPGGRTRLPHSQKNDHLCSRKLTIISNQQSHATPREGARPRPILSWLVSWPSSSSSPGPTKVEEFFVSPESQARLARLLNGSIAGAEEDEGERSGGKHRDNKWKGSSKDLGQTSALSRSGSGSTKLVLNRLTRSMLGLRVGCRARQPKLELPNDDNDETADSKRRRLRPPPSANHAHMVSQGANWTGAAAAARSAPLELTKWLELDLNLRPESVRISRLLGEQQQTPTPGNKVTGPEVRTGSTGGREPRPGEKMAEEVQKVSLDEREPITFVCTTRGARPPARLSWSWSDGSGGSEPIGRLTTSGVGGAPKIIDKTSASDGELESTSQVEFPHGLARQWHGRKLLCAATNEATGGTEASWQPAMAHLELDIRYKPSVQLIERAEIGGSQRRRRRFECLYQANPPINQLVWLVNGRPLVPTGRGELINKTNGHGFDQAEIKQVARGTGETKGSSTIRKHNKLFRFESTRIFAPTDSASESDDDELMASVEQNHGELLLAKKRSGTPEIAAAAAAASGQLSAFVTIDELEEREPFEDDQMVELKCAVINDLGKQESEPLVWESRPTTGRAEPKCRIDERLVALRGQTLNSPDDSLLSQLEVHSLARGWPSDDKFICQLESNTTATRYVWSFVPFEQIAERASTWAKWPSQPGASDQVDLFSQSSELIGAAEKLLPLPPEVAANLSRSVRGLLLCKAQLGHSQEWWPRSGPCLTLVVSEARERDQRRSEALPSTDNCRIEPILVQGHHQQAKGDWVAAQPPQPSGEEDKSVMVARNERLAISVDCSAAPGKESLIFELGVARRLTNKPDQTTTRDAISRQQPSPPPPPGQLDDLMLLDERSSAKTKNKTIQHQLHAAKKLLFTESAEREADTTTSATDRGYRRLALSDLIPSQDFVPKPRQSGANNNDDNDGGEQDEPTKRKESEGGRGVARKLDDKTREANKLAMEESESAGKLHQASDESAQPPSSEMSSSSSSGVGATSSLNEQVELLNELVFTLRASDLVRTSEPRAIYGSELRLAKRAPADAPLTSPPPPRRTKSSQRGSSETGSGASPAAVSLSRSAELLQLLAGEQSATPTNDPEGRGWHNISQTSRSRQLDLVEWGRRHEVGITMAAIGATIFLSGLTLTLIVLVLRRNQRNSPSSADMTSDNNNKSLVSAKGHSSQRPSELVLMRSGSRVSLASRQHGPAVESPLSSERHHDSTWQQTNDLLNADHNYQHKLVGGSLLGDCYLTDDLAAAAEFAASLAGSQVCLSSQVDFLAPPAHQLRSQQSQRTSSSSSQCTTSYTLTNSRRPPRQVRLNLSPQSIGDLDDTQTTIVEHTDYLHHHRHAHFLGSLPRGHYLSGAAAPSPPSSANCDARNLLTLPDLQVAGQFCQHQQQLIFEHQQQLAPTTDCSFEQSPSLMSALSDPTATATGSLSQGHQPTCHLILEPSGQVQLASDFDEEQDT